MSGSKGGERNGKEGEEGERRGEEGKNVGYGGGKDCKFFFFFLREASRLVLCASLQLDIGLTLHESVKRQNRG